MHKANVIQFRENLLILKNAEVSTRYEISRSTLHNKRKPRKPDLTH